MDFNFKKNWPYYLVALIALVVVLIESKGEADFHIFLLASKDLLLNKNIYTETYHEYYHYYYDTLFALLLYPFTLLPLYLAKLIWLSFNVFFTYRIWQVLKDWLQFERLQPTQQKWLSILSFLMVLSFLRDNFHTSQATIFILFLTLQGLAFVFNGKRLSGSLLLALGITIKIMPLVMIPYLIYRKEWKAALLVVLFSITFLFVPGFIIGWEYNLEMLSQRWVLINPGNQQHVMDCAERSFHSLTTLLSTLLMKDCGDQYALDIKRNIANISQESLGMIINLVRLFFAGLTLYFLRSLPFRPAKNSLSILYELSYLCLIVPLIFPHQQHYAFFFVFPATTYLFYFLITNHYSGNEHQKTGKIALITALTIIFLALNAHFILGAFNKYYDHFKVLTYGALVIVPVLAVCHPGKLKTTT